VADVSERVTALVRDEIALARAEVVQKTKSIGRGAAMVLVGAVFGVFALIFVLEAVAWLLDDFLVSGAGNLWVGFGIVAGALVLLTVLALLIAWRFIRVGAPAPTMAIEEAKRIRETVSNPGSSN
jgi:protein-S-isoprenylcysteine O-methyltransferase Ste14